MPMFVWEDFRSSLSPAAKSSRLAISSVAWSEHRPAVFFVLDSAGTLSSFDLLKDDTIPIYSEPSPAFSTSSRDSASARETEAIAKGHQGHNKGEVNAAVVFVRLRYLSFVTMVATFVSSQFINSFSEATNVPKKLKTCSCASLLMKYPGGGRRIATEPG